MSRNQVFRSIMILLGGFAVAYNLTVALHELGHATTVLIGGGKIQQFVLNPFSWSWNLGRNIPDIRFTAWGGVTFGLGFTLLPLVFLHWIRSNAIRFMIKLLAACGLLINGIYLLAGVLFRFGDGGELAQLGVSPVWIILLGSVYILLSFRIWSNLQFHLGMDSDTLMIHRVLVMMGGISPYMIAILVYNRAMNPNQLMIWGGFAAAGIVLSFIFALAGHSHALRRPDPGPEHAITFGAPYFLSAGLLIILAEFLVFGMPDNPF